VKVEGRVSKTEKEREVVVRRCREKRVSAEALRTLGRDKSVQNFVGVRKGEVYPEKKCRCGKHYRRRKKPKERPEGARGGENSLVQVAGWGKGL